MSDNLPAKGNLGKIRKYGLDQQAVNLLTVIPKMTYKEIAESLNAMDGVPEDDQISAQNVINFANQHADVRREVMLANKKHMRNVVFESAEFDMLGYLKDMAARTAFMIETLEEQALLTGNIPDAKSYKSLNSEMRETLKQIEGIHKELYDMEIVREFLLEVVKTLKDVSPEALDVFIQKMRGKRDNSRIVNELLGGGLK